MLTGGPCGGKTTGQAKLATFFENLGWKVFRVPETATVLMSGGIAFGDLNEEQIFDFQVIIDLNVVKVWEKAKLATFFENLGWKVFRIPETEIILMSFGDLNEEQIFDFQVIIDFKVKVWEITVEIAGA